MIEKKVALWFVAESPKFAWYLGSLGISYKDYEDHKLEIAQQLFVPLIGIWNIAELVLDFVDHLEVQRNKKDENTKTNH